MTWEHKAMSFPEVLETTQLYFYMVGALYSFVVLGVLVVQTLRSGLRIRPALPSTTRVACFLTLLLLIGAAGQVFWSCYVWGRLYYSTDYVFGYLPFWPITRRVIDFEFSGQSGSLNGISLLGLNTIWASVTAVVWGSTICLYRKLWRGVHVPASLSTSEHASDE